MMAALLLAISASISFYIVAGYPLLLARWRRFGPAVRKDPEFRPTVTVLMAVYNGQDFVAAKLENLLSLDYPRDLIDILVVSDGSTDATDSIVSSYAARGVSLLRVPHAGKAAALNSAMTCATGDILFFVDVRQVLSPDSLRHLVANFADPTVGAVTGELRFVHDKIVGEAADIDLYWKYEIWARRQHSKIDSIFSTTGCIYAMRRSLVGPIPTDTLVDDAVIPQQAFFRGYRVIVDAGALAYDYGEIHGGEFRRKLRTLAGVWQVWARRPALFSGKNRMRFHFLPHKFGRLVLPWLILAGLISIVFLPAGAVRTSLASLALVVLTLALLDPVLPKSIAIRRISSPARSFAVLNAASLLSVSVFFLAPDRLWRPTRVSLDATETLLGKPSQDGS